MLNCKKDSVLSPEIALYRSIKTNTSRWRFFFQPYFAAPLTHLTSLHLPREPATAQKSKHSGKRLLLLLRPAWEKERPRGKRERGAEINLGRNKEEEPSRALLLMPHPRDESGGGGGGVKS